MNKLHKIILLMVLFAAISISASADIPPDPSDRFPTPNSTQQQPQPIKTPDNSICAVPTTIAGTLFSLGILSLGMRVVRARRFSAQVDVN